MDGERVCSAVGARWVCCSVPDEFGELNAMSSRNHFSCLLTDHDRRRIGVATDDVRHHAGVGDAEIADTFHEQIRIDHVTDPAGAGQMVNSQGVMQRQVFQKRIAGRLARVVPMLLCQLWWHVQGP